MPTTRRRLLRAVTYWYEAHNDLPGHWTTYMWLRLSGEPGSVLIAPDDETLVSLWQAALQYEVEGWILGGTSSTRSPRRRAGPWPAQLNECPAWADPFAHRLH